MNTENSKKKKYRIEMRRERCRVIHFNFFSRLYFSKLNIKMRRENVEEKNIQNKMCTLHEVHGN